MEKEDEDLLRIDSIEGEVTEYKEVMEDSEEQYQSAIRKASVDEVDFHETNEFDDDDEDEE